MQLSTRALPATAAVLLTLVLATACTTSSEFRTTPAAEAQSSEQVDSDLPAVEPLETPAGSLVEETSQSTTEAETAVNEGAVFDRFVLEQFDDYEPHQLGALQLIVSSYCLGLVDDSSINALTTDPTLQQRVLKIEQSTCDDVHRTAFLATSEPTAAATFQEALETRFERVVWWYGIDEFRAHAERFCETRPQPGNFDAAEADLELSVSVEIELYAMIEAGECDFAVSPSSSGDVEIPATTEASSVAGAERFGGVDGRAPLFATGTGGNCPAADVEWANGFDINIFMQSRDMEGIFELSDLALSSPLVSVASTTPREGAWGIFTEQLAGSEVINTLTTDDVFSVFGLVLFGYDGPDEEQLNALIEDLRSAPGVLLVTDGRCTDNATAQLIDG